MVVVLRCRQGSNEGVDLIWGADREEEVAARLTGELDQLSVIAVQMFQVDTRPRATAPTRLSGSR